jgi:hypothetical protein
MQANNGVSTNMGIVYVAPVQNKAGIHFMVNLSDHEVQWTPKIKINQSNQYDVSFVKSALNFAELAQKLLSKKTLLLLITIFIIIQ